MAADSLLPLFHENSAGPMSALPSDNDDVLAELLGGAGDDLLASLLEPGSAYLGQLSPPPFPSSFLPTPPPPPAASQPGDLSSSPPHDCDISDRSSLNTAHSPFSGSNVSCSSDPFGTSPENPGDVMMTSSDILPAEDFNTLLESLTATSYGGSSSEIKIDVDPGLEVRGVQSAACEDTADGPASSSSRKAATLVLTEEEKELLRAEGVDLPTDMPLTKAEQKHLKRVRRKIKNKLSAQESRKRKKEYVEGLEERIECCTDTNNRLRHRVDSLETENKSLLQQLEKLRSVVAGLYPPKLQAGTLLMVVSLSFSLLVFPWPRPLGSPSSTHTVTVHSRTLLFTDTDEFGNIIDPESGVIVSEHGGLSPKPPYPWTMQSPAFLSTFRHTSTHTIRDLY